MPDYKTPQKCFPSTDLGGTDKGLLDERKKERKKILHILNETCRERWRAVLGEAEGEGSDSHCASSAWFVNIFSGCKVSAWLFNVLQTWFHPWPISVCFACGCLAGSHLLSLIRALSQSFGFWLTVPVVSLSLSLSFSRNSIAQLWFVQLGWATVH